jgi:hypothetical protein
MGNIFAIMANSVTKEQGVELAGWALPTPEGETAGRSVTDLKTILPLWFDYPAWSQNWSLEEGVSIFFRLGRLEVRRRDGWWDSKGFQPARFLLKFWLGLVGI